MKALFSLDSLDSLDNIKIEVGAVKLTKSEFL